MTYAEYYAKEKAMHAEYKRLGGHYGSDEARALWSGFYNEKRDNEMKFHQFCCRVADRVIAEQGFKLSKAQRAAVESLICGMVKAKLGREWMLNNCEYYVTDENTLNWVFDAFYDKGIYFVTMNTKTLEAIASKGIWEIIKVGHSSSDNIKPCFDFELIESI